MQMHLDPPVSSARPELGSTKPVATSRSQNRSASGIKDFHWHNPYFSQHDLLLKGASPSFEKFSDNGTNDLSIAFELLHRGLELMN